MSQFWIFTFCRRVGHLRQVRDGDLPAYLGRFTFVIALDHTALGRKNNASVSGHPILP